MEKLKPCPCCGENDLFGPHSYEYVGDKVCPHCVCSCNTCGLEMTENSSSIDQLVTKWNTRVNETLLNKYEHALRHICETGVMTQDWMLARDILNGKSLDEAISRQQHYQKGIQSE